MADCVLESDMLKNGSRGLKAYVRGEDEVSRQSVQGKHARRT